MVGYLDRYKETAEIKHDAFKTTGSRFLLFLLIKEFGLKKVKEDLEFVVVEYNKELF